MGEYKTFREREIEEMPIGERRNAKERNEYTIALYLTIWDACTNIIGAANVMAAQKRNVALELSELQKYLTKTDEIAAVKQLFDMIDTAQKMKENAMAINKMFKERIF